MLHELLAAGHSLFSPLYPHLRHLLPSVFIIQWYFFELLLSVLPVLSPSLWPFCVLFQSAFTELSSPLNSRNPFWEIFYVWPISTAFFNVSSSPSSKHFSLTLSWWQLKTIASLNLRSLSSKSQSRISILRSVKVIKWFILQLSSSVKLKTCSQGIFARFCIVFKHFDIIL